MTLASKINNIIYYSTKITDEFGKNNKATCIGCNGELIYHRNIANVKTQHWVHKISCLYETEPETKEHLVLKELIYEAISNKYEKYIPDSVFIGDQKPDIYIEDKQTNERIAIEIQCSPLTYEKFLERTQGYSNKGIYVFWVFGEKWYSKKYEMFDTGKIEKKINVVEKKLHQLNYGRVYYAEIPFSEKLELNISAIHFGLVIREKDYCENCWWEDNVPNWDGDCDDRCWVFANGLDGGIVKNILKSTKEMIAYEPYFTNNIEFVLFQNEGYKLARLNDPYFWGDLK